MKLKYRYPNALGQMEYNEVELPDDVQFYVGQDWEHNDVYEGDELFCPRNSQQFRIAVLKPMLYDKKFGWFYVDYDAAVKYSCATLVKTKQTQPTNRWRGKVLADIIKDFSFAKGTSDHPVVLDYRDKILPEKFVTGTLNIIRNDNNLDRFDCYIVDHSGGHLVDFATLERVND